MTTKNRTIFSFSALGLFFVLAWVSWSWAWSQPQINGVPVPFRKVLELNGKIWGQLHSNKRVGRGRKSSGEPRVNGDIGIEQEIDLAKWKLEVDSIDGKKTFLTMKDLQKLPRTEATFNFKCIEGWSEVMSFAGVKFSDFLFAYGLTDRAPYVGLETPDGTYYVSIDMESMLHPQTLLAFEMNGKALAQENGAPLRLAIPVKYGIKNLKRIGKIFFSQTRPRDYWEEQGYDWFSGL
jgi:DMSO/TMAO reductase YedYZ molybdopterin-dependent catalytic subunit